MIPQAINSDQKNEANKEIDILKGLKHPNVVRLVNLFMVIKNFFSYEENWFENGNLMVLMEFCSSGDLHQHIQRHKPRFY